MTKEEFKLGIAKGKVFTHKEKGHKYRVRELLISKHPDTGVWYNAVLYMRVDGEDAGRLFVRSDKSFIDNFEIIKEQNG